MDVPHPPVHMKYFNRLQGNCHEKLLNKFHISYYVYGFEFVPQ